ncbi:alkene reductase [Streptomyces sp. HNM0574]|uniref:alkene reductase n=1 Tax=Streptomyces sp. HNM0574 TaxID=2714954 RepID=UPI00146ADF43|nr:alkene reductase [Streptomyces sp. HNM0574]NLU69473.1 alkene reductase [Streptomyces sp. HNM0574]
MSPLSQPLNLGALTLPNRAVMAPLTRSRASEGRVPNALMAEYYGQRSGAGLIISEATSVSPMAIGYPNTPGIWNDEQTEAWKQVTETVHAKGGRIFLQLWHVGRISDPVYLGGELPLAPSAVAAEGHVRLLRPKRQHPVPRALETEEIAGVVEEFRRGAENAKRAGFDGVELHAANGYLIDSFLQDASNHRTDEYGGTVENRARFLLEITDAVASVWGGERVGVHLAPRGDQHSMGDSDPKSLFLHVAEELGRRDVAFLCLREYEGEDSLLPHIKEAFGGPVIANEEMTPESARRLVSEGVADAVAWGEDYIATPDLAERLASGTPFNTRNPETYYAEGALGYTDYPFADAR